MSLDYGKFAARIINQIQAIVAYVDTDQRCVFANEACREWLGKDPAAMVGLHLSHVLGPLYELNLPYILRALDGEKQVFERRIPSQDDIVREAIVSYNPDVVNGIVRGFIVNVTDVTVLREREIALERVIRERDEALAEVRVLRGLLPICSGCKSIRDAAGQWHSVEKFVADRTDAEFSHGLCPACAERYFPGVVISDKP